MIPADRGKPPPRKAAKLRQSLGRFATFGAVGSRPRLPSQREGIDMQEFLGSEAFEVCFTLAIIIIGMLAVWADDYFGI